MNFKRAEHVPFPVSCVFHRHEKSFWFVADHPYTALSGIDGSYEIPLIPHGTYQFFVWHEETGYLDRFSAQIDAKEVKRPTLKMTIDSVLKIQAKAKPKSDNKSDE